MTTRVFQPAWRRQKSGAFDLTRNSTAGRTVRFPLWGREVDVYANANFSVYSAQACNAKCPFCVEELRPASRGRELYPQRQVETRDAVYLSALSATLDALRTLCPTISITGGEPSIDPRLPKILDVCGQFPSPRRSLTTNASGLLDRRNGKRVVDWITESGVQHLNISRAAADCQRNARIMVLPQGLELGQLKEAIAAANGNGSRVRLSCVLLTESVNRLAEVKNYLRFAESLGVDNVIFRQLMGIDRNNVLENYIVRYSTRHRVRLEPILDEISADEEFQFQRQIVGYYYYVEVWEFRGIDVVFEEADLAQLEDTKTQMPGVIHELIFHPNATLASTWQPWDGVLGPPALTQEGVLA